MDYILVIPARFKSTRFPGKPLIDLNGKSMLLRTYEQCTKAVDPELVYVATEDQRIVEHCDKLGINVKLTSDDCLTGTDRVAEVAQSIKANYYINVQGDEPLFDPNDILKVVHSLYDFPGEILNGYCEITDEEQYKSLSIPKVVFQPNGKLLYMSRSPIPSNKSGQFLKAWRQVCIYAFPYDALKKFSEVKEKSPMEALEDIEILRFIEMGFEVRMLELSQNSIAIDNPEDVKKVLRKIMPNV
jgi:3-deoxy-manno-octulosonate cytidylyltransferase (CMP-KDO synthetase)